MFICDKCGLCCMNLNMSPLYSTLDSGDGSCRFFDKETKLCAIYEKRPIICNVDKMYEQCFKDKMTKEEYYALNYEACEKIKKQN